jgi:GT2 family glycosyltransferase
MISPKVGIVIPNFNAKMITCECIDSLRKISYPDFSIYLVENGSKDHPGAFFREKYPWISVIESEKNLGFAGGCNLGMKRALEEGAEYILLLNNDTVVAGDFLDRLVEAGEADDKIGMLTPKIRYYEPDTHLWFAGGTYDLFRGIPDHIGEREIDKGQYDEPCELTFISGCSPLVKKALLDDIGMLREDLFLICEDLDWCIKARKNGWKLQYVPKSLIWHRESFSTMEHIGRPLQLYFATRNLLFVHKTHSCWYHNLVFYPWFSIRWILYQCLKHTLKRDFKMVRAVFRAVNSYMKGESGMPEWFRTSRESSRN